MPRGKKKTEIANTLSNNNAETSAEIAAPVDVKGQPKKEAAAATDKPKNKAGRKPKANNSKANKSSAAPKSDKSVKTAASSDTANQKSKAGRKPKSTNVKAEKTVAAKTTKTSEKTSAKNAAVTKEKRTYNKKANTSKAEDIIIQSSGGEYTMSDITEMCKNDYRGGGRKQIKSIRVYLKSENNAIRAYYVINDKANGYIDL